MLGDRNAAMMCYRLLFWFPRARKNGGWVYKSWRDWLAECNLSQSQVKRVHRKGALEAVGITRKTMKASGAPTTHYGLDLERLLDCVANTLGISRSQIDDWIRDSQQAASGQPDESFTPQSNRLEDTNQDGRSNPIQMAETTQSITSSNQQENNSQSDDNTNNNKGAAVAVITSCCDPESVILDRLMVLGISQGKSQSFLENHGMHRLEEVLAHAEGRSLGNPAGFVIRALEENWAVSSGFRRTINREFMTANRYVTGKYAAFIEH